MWEKVSFRAVKACLLRLCKSSNSVSVSSVVPHGK